MNVTEESNLKKVEKCFQLPGIQDLNVLKVLLNYSQRDMVDSQWLHSGYIMAASIFPNLSVKLQYPSHFIAGSLMIEA